LGTDDASKTHVKPADDLGEKLDGIEGTLVQLSYRSWEDDCPLDADDAAKGLYLLSQLDASADFPPATQKTAVQERV